MRRPCSEGLVVIVGALLSPARRCTTPLNEVAVGRQGMNNGWNALGSAARPVGDGHKPVKTFGSSVLGSPSRYDKDMGRC